MPAPTTGILDSFVRADENPLANGWNKIDTGQAAFQIVSNQCVLASVGSPTSAYLATSYSDVEAYVTLATLGGAGSQRGVVARVQQPGTSGFWDGYSLNYNSTTHTLSLNVITNASIAAVLASDTGNTLASGDKLFLKIVGNALIGSVFTGGGWVTVLNANDSTYASGPIGIIGSTNPTMAYTDFGGGTPVVAPSQLQIPGPPISLGRRP